VFTSRHPSPARTAASFLVGRIIRLGIASVGVGFHPFVRRWRGLLPGFIRVAGFVFSSTEPVMYMNTIPHTTDNQMKRRRKKRRNRPYRDRQPVPKWIDLAGVRIGAMEQADGSVVISVVEQKTGDSLAGVEIGQGYVLSGLLRADGSGRVALAEHPDDGKVRLVCYNEDNKVGDIFVLETEQAPVEPAGLN
jgi:hypothetical protein